jgi:hypothetical protein
MLVQNLMVPVAGFEVKAAPPLKISARFRNRKT